MNEYVSPTRTLFNPPSDQGDGRRKRKSILFVCAYRGSRAQIARHYCQQFASNRFKAFSAGFEPGPLSGIPVEVMREQQCNLSQAGNKSVFEYFAENTDFDYVISLCQASGAEQCPVFRRSIDKLYGKTAIHICWDIGDFRTLSGDDAEKLAAARLIRDTIAGKVHEFVSTERAPMLATLNRDSDTITPPGSDI